MQRSTSETLLTGVFAIALYLVWMVSYSWQLASTGVSPSGGSYVSASDFILRMARGLAVFAVPVAVWAGLALAGGLLVRHQGFGFRLLIAWLAAVVIGLPFAIAAAVSVSASDGWRGLAALSVAIPVAAPFLVIPVYCTAAALLQLRRRRRAA